MRWISLLMLVCLPSWAVADWTLDSSNSSVYYTSTKNNTVSENNRFTQVTGSIDAQGALEIQIRLDSVDTGIAIRDERVRGLLFEVSQFPQAVVRATLEPTRLDVTDSQMLDVPMTLSLHGLEMRYVAKVNVLNGGNGILHVSSREPILVNAADFNLQGGIEKLREIAGLQSISPVVPVGFSLVLVKTD